MVTITISIPETSYDKIRDIEVESGKTKSTIIRQLIQYGFAYIEKEKFTNQINRGNQNGK